MDIRCEGCLHQSICEKAEENCEDFHGTCGCCTEYYQYYCFRWDTEVLPSESCEKWEREKTR